jgi:hypothetical protein
VTFVVLFLLAVIWAIYLASWLKSRGEHRSVNSISSFNKHLSVLERTSPARQGVSAVPNRAPAGSVGYGPATYGMATYGMGRPPSVMTRSEARRRRRDVLFALGGAVLITLMLTVVLGGPFLWLQLLADALLVGYVVLLVRSQRLAVERRSKVRYLPPVGVGDMDPAYLVPQSASANY